jgi:predicted transporter
VLGTIPWCIAAVAIPVALHPENFPVNLISVGLLVFALAVFAHSLEQISDDIAHIAKAIDASAETFDDPSNVGPLENIRRLRRALNRDDLV